jgi:hypothetical protein
MLINISRDTFRTFCNGFRHAAGGTISNTTMMEAVSAALGWRRDALTHHLKSKNLTIEVEEGILKSLLRRVNDLANVKLRMEDVQPIFDNFTNSNVGPVAVCAPGSEAEWQLYRRVALLLEAKQADAANEYARQLNDTTPAVRLLKGMIGLALGQMGAEANCASALRNQPELIHALANLSGIEIDDPIAPFEEEQPWDQLAPIKRIHMFPLKPMDSAFFPRGVGGGLGHKLDEDRLARVIGGLRRPELKGKAYRAVVDAYIPLPNDFKPYLEPTPPKVDSEKVVCLFDGNERMMMKSYLKNNYCVSARPYLAFFNVGQEALMNPHFAASKARYAPKNSSES